MLDTVKNRVNGLDLEALGETVEAIGADPAKALVAFDVTTRWTGQTRSETVVDGYTLGGERIGRTIEDREALLAQQHQAARWTYIGSGLVHQRFKSTLETMSPKAAARLAEVAPVFA